MSDITSDVKDAQLIPWQVQPQHEDHETLDLLRLEGRARAHLDVTGDDAKRLAAWHEYLDRENVVVAYISSTTVGFFYTPRATNDVDIVRKP